MSNNEFNEASNDLRSSLEEKESDDLYDIWDENDNPEWPEETFDMIEDILEERNIHIPEKGVIFTCENCDRPILSDAKYCYKCGEYLGDNCIVCNRPIPKEAKYCPYCGRRDPTDSYADPADNPYIKRMRSLENMLEGISSDIHWILFSIGFIFIAFIVFLFRSTFFIR